MGKATVKVINLPSLKVIRLKRVKISLHSVRKFTAVYGGGEGGSWEKGGRCLHHHVHTNVGKFSRLFIFAIIKQITFKLGDSTTWSMSQVEKKTVKGSSNNSFSYTVKLWNFILGWKTQFHLPVKPMNLSWLIVSNQHTVVTCLKNQLVFFRECYNTKPIFLFY